MKSCQNVDLYLVEQHLIFQSYLHTALWIALLVQHENLSDFEI